VGKVRFGISIPEDLISPIRGGVLHHQDLIAVLVVLLMGQPLQEPTQDLLLVFGRHDEGERDAAVEPGIGLLNGES